MKSCQKTLLILALLVISVACTSEKKEAVRSEDPGETQLSQEVYLAGDSITRYKAGTMYCDFQTRASNAYNSNTDSVVAVLFWRAQLNYFLDESKFPGVQGLRFYFVLSTREDGSRYRDLIAVPVDDKGNDLVPFLENTGTDSARRDVLNHAFPCPAKCGMVTSAECP
jgi:hypothetical protein